MNLANIKVSHKLGSAFALIALVITSLAGVVYFELTLIEEKKAAVERGQAVMDVLTSLEESIDQQESNTRAYVSVQNPKYLERIAEQQANFDSGIAALRKLLTGIEGASGRIDSLVAAEAAYSRDVVDAETRLAADPATVAQAVDIVRSGVSAKLMAAFDEAFADIQSRQQARLDAADVAQAEAFATSYMALVTGGTIALALAAIFGIILSRSITGPVLATVGQMRRLQDGDTSIEVPEASRKDEFGQMGVALLSFRDAAIDKKRTEERAAADRAAADAERKRNEAEKDRIAAEDQGVTQALADGLAAMAGGDLTHRITAAVPARAEALKTNFNAAIGQLQQAVSVVLSNVAAIRSGAGEISQAADDLSRRTEQQAASLEETAAALDEITATVNKTASGARQASSVVGATKGDAETSGIVVRDAVAAMSAIESSAQQISQIIGVIDEIAFQTNLLALNAGVEAARAGDAGRGFAVVASEVRALAQRSAEAAKEIKTLIQASTAQVGSGVKLVDQTGEALGRIVGRVAEIDALVSEIAASAQEQATGLSQVNTAVNQMDQVTQQNAAMVEESTAASHALAQEAESLAQSVSGFRVGQVASLAGTARLAAKPVAKPAHAPVVQMKAKGPGGAARHIETSPESWEEF